MNKDFKADAYRNRGNGYVVRFLWCLRMAQSGTLIGKLFTAVPLRYYRKLYGLEILPATRLGAGLYLGHAYNITVNPHAAIGKNCNIHKGVLIGEEKRGARKGAPTIGDNVWIGINAAIVGKVMIGSDVLIAPGAYINTDVPSHSVVFGNPCMIKHRDNATEGYINNIV